MLGIEEYGSDSDSDEAVPPKQQPTSAKSTKATRPPKKITISLPAISSSKDEDAEEDRPSKKRKIGAGSSSLLSILPAPKEKNPAPQIQRVLGAASGPGLNFHSTPRTHDFTVPATSDEDNTTLSETAEETNSSSTLFRPTSLGKGKKNVSVEENNINQPLPSQVPPTATPPVDFFSLGSTKSSLSALSGISASTSSLPSLSSAPDLPTFNAPEPTPTDPYPGYYQLPSGSWAAYDPEYYAKFMKKWESEYNAHVRALEKGTIKGFEGLKDASVEEVNALKEMERAKKEIQDREAKKAITQGAGGGPAAPRMNINASKMTGIARSRHQLSTLLKEAYENREALEERIAQGKRNRKEAGNKYGF
ncbi:mitotic checkpoint regulator, MAD2B-interacting-domain-containing protein [Gymnopilus junonius]|uniref:Mitotic checkpoint regulator, MAD2B-interacting-domain-containing protein n=1 Tax=Gymnopilus junonius TaxID=109634 RepID=A0A9P5NVT6_GYMJU|nr:mitotic checkpoint regulator, MAD2B-interacting-domain-containing protein [Gymnopilus junonius]